MRHLRTLVINISVSSACLLMQGGCAYTTAVPVLSGTEEGFRTPECYPFLVVNGGQHQLLMVPNPRKEQAVQFGTFLAKNNVKLTFSECGSPAVESDQDSTEVAIKLIDILGNLANQTPPTATPRSGEAVGDRGTTDFQVFSFVFDEEGGFVGMKPQILPNSFVRVAGSTGAERTKAPTKPEQKTQDKPADPPKKDDSSDKIPGPGSSTNKKKS